MSWLYEARKIRPMADAIAIHLNALGAEVCEHEHDPCYSRCSVRRQAGVWVVISEEERQRWFGRVIRLMEEREREKKARGE